MMADSEREADAATAQSFFGVINQQLMKQAGTADSPKAEAEKERGDTMQLQSKPGAPAAGTHKDLQIGIPNKVDGMPLPDLHELVERLHFSPADGRIWLDDSRMFLLRTEAFGALRQELIESLGIESARGLLTRMGYLCGAKAAALARKMCPSGSPSSVFLMGPQMHALEGVVRVEPVRLEMDSVTGHFYCEVLWIDSSEDESHMAVYGVGSESACWMQTGYASGYSSHFMGKRILFREVDCISQGAKTCRAIGKPVEAWDDPDLDLHYLQAQPLSVKPVGVGALNPGPQPVAIGASSGYFGVIHRINRVAPTRATVLLLGESGVGKSMFACEVHAKSPRAAHPFLQLNCAAIPEQLMESELFGVEKGAYTGVTESRMGRFEAADKGTLFLDEVALLSLTAQAKLLRVLQSGEFERLGSTKARKVDVRVVAATNENLFAAVAEGRFRKDLYYRLNVFSILIPPLRERRADIPLLLERLLHQLCERHGRRVSGLTSRAMEALLTYQWPGNIRELENVLERGIILADDGGAIDIVHLRSAEDSPAGAAYLGLGETGVPTAGPAPANTRDHEGTADIEAWAASVISAQRATLGEIEAALLQAALKSAQGNVSKAATLLGLSRAQMDYRTKKAQ